MVNKIMEEILVPDGTPLLRDPMDKRISKDPKGIVSILGVPWDWSITGRPGSREAPSYLRKQLYKFTTHAPGLYSDIDFFFKDLGNVRIAPGDREITAKRVIEASRLSYDSSQLSVFLGGDHSITKWTIHPLAEKGRVGIILLDAHYDMRTVSEGYTSGSWLWELYTEHKNKIDALIIGVSDYLNPPYLKKRAEEAGFIVVSRMEILEKGIDQVRSLVKEFIKREHDFIYLSIDTDHLDNSIAPGVNAPNPLGLTSIESYQILSSISESVKIDGIDVTEYSPLLDINDITLQNVTKLLLYTIHKNIIKWRR